VREIDTYALRDFFPLTPEVYAGLFARLNDETWPLAVICAVAALLAGWGHLTGRRRWAGVLVGAAWALSGWLFHLRLYAELNWAAAWIGWGFVTQGLLVAVWAGRARAERPGARRRTATGVLWALVAAWPALTSFGPRGAAGAEVFGLAPDPTVLAAWAWVGGHARVPALVWPLLLAATALAAATAWLVGAWTGALVVAGAVAALVVTR
jgi:hypothetical protein